MAFHRQFLPRLLAVLAIFSMAGQPIMACTGITLKAKDGAVVFGRTMEWGSFDLNSRLVIVPRGYKFTSLLDDHKPGLTWIGKYGVAGIDAVGKDVVVDGMNEKGLQVGLFYHPGTSQYQKLDVAIRSAMEN